MKYSNTALKELKKRYKNVLIKCLMMNAICFAFSYQANAETISERLQITQNTTFNNLSASNIHSTTSQNGGVFYLENVQDVSLVFDGETSFSNNSINNGGMGGAIANGWLSTKDSAQWSPFTPGGKIIFNGQTLFSGNETNNPNGGGALFNYGIGTTASPDIQFNDETSFSSNKALTPTDIYVAGGGAIHHRGGAIVFNEKALFSQNSSASRGGAILSAGDILFKKEVEFSNNTSSSSGGAISVLGGNITFNDKATFSNNTSTNGSGAAIASDGGAGDIIFKGLATFNQNTGTATLWNNSPQRNIYFENGAIFESNTNTYNGTLQNAGSIFATAGDFKFINNTGSNGGAIKNSGNIEITTSGEVLIDHNKTSSSAGAIDNSGTLSLTASKVTFSNNSSQAGYGGAIFNNGNLKVLGAENIFSNNTSNETNPTKSGGGAIHNRSAGDKSQLIIGTDSSVNTFEANSSNTNGGAIAARSVDGETQSVYTALKGTTTFSNNTATNNGGAVWNYTAEKDGTIGTATFETNGVTTFTDNSSNGLGGAIYNNSDMIFNGETIFSGNTDSTGANDIYNDGSLTFNGDVTLDGGITGNGSVTFKQGTSLTTELNRTTILADKVSFEGNNTLNLTVANGMADAEYQFIEAATFIGKENISIQDNTVYNLELTDSGTIQVSVKSGNEMRSAIDSSISNQEANTLSAVLNSNGHGTSLGNQLADRLSLAAQSGQTDQVIRAIKDVAPSTSQIVPNIAKESSAVISRVSTIRMDAIKGTSGGDTFEGAGIWAQGLYNHTKQDSTASNAGFKANSHGMAIGIDTNLYESMLLGIGYGYLHTDADSLGQDLEVDGHNFFIYGKYQPNKWYVNAILNYNYGKYTEKKSPMGVYLRSKFDVNSYGAQVMTGYALPSGFTTEIGLRYLYIDADSYYDGVQRIRSNTDDILTAVAGVKYQRDIYQTPDLILKPSLRVALTYDLISDNSTANVSVLGGGNYRIDSHRLHRFGIEAGAGLTATMGNLDLSLEYNGAFRKDYDSQGGILRARYHF